MIAAVLSTPPPKGPAQQQQPDGGAARGPASPARREATLVAAGDVMLARGVANRIREEGCGYPFAATAGILSDADIALANLESPLGVRGRPIPNKLIWFRAAPESIECLEKAGLDLVTVANNHILDYDTENFLETLITA